MEHPEYTYEFGQIVFLASVCMIIGQGCLKCLKILFNFYFYFYLTIF